VQTKRALIAGFLVTIGAILLFLPAAAAAAQLSIPPLATSAGKTVVVPLKIDAVDNLAGIKLTLQYDTSLLTFRHASKTRETSSLMHVVNARKPGRLIVVMAGAVGIKGKDFAILNLSFQVSPKITAAKTTQLQITEAQLMSDQLKTIPCTISTAAMRITPAAAPSSTAATQ